MASNKCPSFLLPLLLITLASMAGNTMSVEASHRRLLDTSLPALPKPELPSLPKLPALPEPELPSLPKVELPHFPTLLEPALPTIPKPEVPKLPELPTLPTIPALSKDMPIPTLKPSHSTTTP